MYVKCPPIFEFSGAVRSAVRNHCKGIRRISAK